ALAARGRHLASVGQNLHLWSLSSWPPTELGRQPVRGNRLALSPDGRQAAVGHCYSANAQVLVVDPLGGQRLARLQLTNSLHRLAFSPDGRWLATMTGHPSRVTLWAARNWICVHTFKAFRTWGQTLEFSPDSRLLAAGAEDGSIRLWDTA